MISLFPFHRSAEFQRIGTFLFYTVFFLTTVLVFFVFFGHFVHRGIFSWMDYIKHKSGLSQFVHPDVFFAILSISGYVFTILFWWISDQKPRFVEVSVFIAVSFIVLFEIFILILGAIFAGAKFG